MLAHSSQEMEAPPPPPPTRLTTTRAPPPTPIATGKGLRSAAVDDRVLTEFLENSLKVPNLALPSEAAKPLAPKPMKIALSSIVAGDGVAARAALAGVGAFWIDGEGFEWMEEVRSLVEVWGRQTHEEELCWSSAATELDGNRIFREEMGKITSALVSIVESIIKVLVGHAENRSSDTMFNNAHSFLRIRKHEISRCLRGLDATKHHPSCALRLQISVNDHQLSVRALDSDYFTLPAGSMLVSMGKQLEEFLGGEFKSFSGEIFFESSDDWRTPVSLELVYSLPDLNFYNHSSTKILSLTDQLLILLTIVFLYNLLS